MITASLLAVAALCSQIPRLEIDASTESFLGPGTPQRLTYDAFRDQFGRDDAAVIAVRTRDVFSFDFLERLRALHRDLEEGLPHLDDVTSLTNVRHTRGEADRLVVGEFLESWPTTNGDLEVLRERALSHPLYRDSLVSSDATTAIVTARPALHSNLAGPEEVLGGFDDPAGFDGSAGNGTNSLSGDQMSEFVGALHEIVDRHHAADFDIYVAGQAVLNERVVRGMIGDIGLFTGLLVVAIGAALGWLFRSLSAVAIALVTAVLAAACGFGVMVVTGRPLTAPSQVIPTFLLAVGVGNSVHLLAIFFQARHRGRSVEDALAFALGHSGLAIVLSGLTTAGSLSSFLGASLAPVSDFGLVAPLSVLVALALSLVLLPALMVVVPMHGLAAAISPLRRFPVACGALGYRHVGPVLVAWLILFAVSGIAASRVHFSNDPLDWFDPDEPQRVATELLNDKFGGANSIEVLVDSGRENGLHEPELLRRIEALEAHAEGLPIGDSEFGSAKLSIAQVVKEIHQALDGGRPESWAIPAERRLVAQELLLFEMSGSDDLEEVVDSSFQVGRVSLSAPMIDAVLYVPVLERLQRDFAEILGDTRFQITGHFALAATTTTALVQSLARTYTLAFALIAPFMIVLLGSFRTGMLSMLPAVGSILVTLGAMELLGLPLDAFTLLVGSIALGLAVDDTIHFMHNYARFRQRGQDVESAIRSTLESTGQALLFTSIVLAVGFLVYTQAQLNMLRNFGLLTAIAITLAFLANVTLAPALVTAVARLRGEAGAR